MELLESMKKNEEAGTKYDGGKVRMDLLPSEALFRIAEVLTFGAAKYDSHNWRKGFKWSRTYAAAQRHLAAWNEGEDVDPESNISHLAHAACCLMFLLDFEKTKKELDDRYTEKD